MRTNKIIAIALGAALSCSPLIMASTASAAEPAGTITPSAATAAASEPSITEFLDAASKLEVYVNGKKYEDFDYKKGIDVGKLMTDKTATATYDNIPSGATVEVRNIPDSMKQYITETPNADGSGVTVTAKASGYTINYKFNYAKATTNGYSVDDLKKVTATVDGKPVTGFDYKGGTFTVPEGAKTAALSGIPSGWTKTASKTGLGFTITSPDGKVKVTYTFTSKTGGTTTPSNPGGTTTKPSAKPTSFNLGDVTKGGYGIYVTAKGSTPKATTAYPKWGVLAPGSYTLSYTASDKQNGTVTGTVYADSPVNKNNGVVTFGKPDTARNIKLKTKTSTATTGEQVNQKLTLKEGDAITLPAGSGFGTITFTPSGSTTPTGSYNATDLKNVTATIAGKPVNGFDPVKGGTFKVAPGSFIILGNVPQGWKADKTQDPTGTKWLQYVLTSPDGKVKVTYRFVADSSDGTDAKPNTPVNGKTSADTDGKTGDAAAPEADGNGDRLAQTGTTLTALSAAIVFATIAGGLAAMRLRRQHNS